MKSKYILLFIIFLLSSVFSYAQKPLLVCKNSMHNFGEIEENTGKVEHTFIITNLGKSPLILNKIETSCGCTTPSWSKKPIPPGGTSEIKVVFDPKDQKGKFIKAIVIYSNASKGISTLRITGVIK